MRIDLAAAHPLPRRNARSERRGPWVHLVSALLALAEGKAELLRHSERAWASITFAGTRHTLAFAFIGSDAVATGERFVAELPEHEFAIPGQLVADAAVIAVEHTVLPESRMTVEIELLLLEDG